MVLRDITHSHTAIEMFRRDIQGFGKDVLYKARLG